MPNVLFTIGYAGRTLPDLAAALEAHDVTTLVDTRFVPRSRNYQFNRDYLAAYLGDRGMVYYHSADLGNVNYKHPEKGIQLFRPGVGVTWLCNLLDNSLIGSVAILCGCRDAQICHRKVVADMTLARLGPKEIEVAHL